MNFSSVPHIPEEPDDANLKSVLKHLDLALVLPFHLSHGVFWRSDEASLTKPGNLIYAPDGNSILRVPLRILKKNNVFNWMGNVNYVGYV